MSLRDDYPEDVLKLAQEAATKVKVAGALFSDNYVRPIADAIVADRKQRNLAQIAPAAVASFQPTGWSMLDQLLPRLVVGDIPSAFDALIMENVIDAISRDDDKASKLADSLQSGLRQYIASVPAAHRQLIIDHAQAPIETKIGEIVSLLSFSQMLLSQIAIRRTATERFLEALAEPSTRPMVERLRENDLRFTDPDELSTEDHLALWRLVEEGIVLGTREGIVQVCRLSPAAKSYLDRELAPASPSP